MTIAITSRSGAPLSAHRVHDHKTFKFSGGELQVRVQPVIRPEVQVWRIKAHIRNSDDLMELLLATDACRRIADQPVQLVMPYIPYARQDRVCAPGEALSLKVFATLINSMNYQKVTVWDAHSDVALALIDRAHHRPQYVFTEKLLPLKNRKALQLVAPDAGAAKKVYESAKLLDTPVLLASKHRDPKTGEITDTEVHWPAKWRGSPNLLIVDDICDGGGTFIRLAEELRANDSRRVGQIFLYVTHGIFSKGLEPLLACIDHIYTANSWLPDQEGLTII